MIPRKLELKNFLSYGEQTQVIDFAHYAFICLSGKNGHGKSALLDALTWSLWGQARKTSGTSKADDGLLRLGQTRMMVSLEFEFNARIYRVRREYARTYGKPYATLDFEIFDEEKQKFSSLTDKTIRQTQAKIEQLIGLDFETFSNSAFIRQGQSNEFSKKSSKERKQILATILGLSRYDTLQQKALDNAKLFNEQKKLLSMMQDQHRTALAQRAEITRICTEKKGEMNTLTASLEQKHKTMLMLEKELMQSEQAKVHINQLTLDLDSIKKNYTLKLHSFTQLVQNWKTAHKEFISYQSVFDLEERKRALHHQEKILLETHQKSLVLQEQALTLQDSYQKRYTLLKADADKKIYELTLNLDRQNLDIKHHRQLYLDKKNRLNSVTKDLQDLSGELAILQNELKNQALFEVKLEADKLQFEKRRSFYAVLVQKGNWVKNELTELEHRKKIVHDPTNPSCPLCEQVLTLKRKQFLSSRFSDQEHFLHHRFNRLGLLIKRLKEILVLQHQELELAQTQQALFAKNASRQKEIQQQLVLLAKEQETVAQEVLTIEQKLIAIEHEMTATRTTYAEQEKIIGATIEKDLELVQIRTALTELTAQRGNLSYDPILFKQLQEDIKNLEMLAQKSQQLTNHQALQQERRSKIASLIFELKQFKQHLFSIEKQLAALQAIQANEQELTLKLNQEKKQLTDMLNAKDLLLKEIAQQEHELSRLDELAKQYEANVKKMIDLDSEIEEYTYLAQAFGKNGIQALLIEDAIPEIEREANDILSRLTNNQAQIFIESLRDLKSGGVKETLDIQISDTAGIRPYEMFSGGEAFRIDFSLRIAISKLLARRAGTALQTLIIDEGFGSQDEEGLGAIMQALYAVQGDFSKIIIVSHLSEFKENFPVHLIVEKGPNGSVVHVEERG